MIWKIQFMQKRKRKNFSPSLFSLGQLAFPFFAAAASPGRQSGPARSPSGPTGRPSRSIGARSPSQSRTDDRSRSSACARPAPGQPSLPAWPAPTRPGPPARSVPTRPGLPCMQGRACSLIQIRHLLHLVVLHSFFFCFVFLLLKMR
jgi:hypothetical protein